MISKKVILIGVCGGSGSGKTTLSQMLRDTYGNDGSLILYQDSYYKDQSEKFDGDGGSVNFDHPDSIDFDLLQEHLKSLKLNRPVNIPHYDFATHKRISETKEVLPHPIILVDGTLILSQEKIRNCLDLSIFLDIPDNIRFERRLKRDTTERGRTLEGVKKQYDTQVRPMYDQFIDSNKKYADLSYKDNNCFDQILLGLKAKFGL